MKIHKNMLGTEDKIDVNEVAIDENILLGAGVIVESDSNTDGQYVKFGDGTLICWGEARLEVEGTNTYYLRKDIYLPVRYKLADYSIAPVLRASSASVRQIFDIGTYQPSHFKLNATLQQIGDQKFKETDYSIANWATIGRWK